MIEKLMTMLVGILLALAGWSLSRTFELSTIQAVQQDKVHKLERYVEKLQDQMDDMQDSDKEIMSMLDECEVSYQIVLTKIDKIINEEDVLLKAKNSIQKFIAVHPEIHSTSSHKGRGIEELRNTISSIVE